MCQMRMGTNCSWTTFSHKEHRSRLCTPEAAFTGRLIRHRANTTVSATILALSVIVSLSLSLSHFLAVIIFIYFFIEI